MKRQPFEKVVISLYPMVLHDMRNCTVILILACLCRLSSVKLPAGSDQPVSYGSTVRDIVTLVRDGSTSAYFPAYKSYSFLVSEDILSVKISVYGASADLDLYVKRGSRIESYEEADFPQAGIHTVKPVIPLWQECIAEW